jgi:hypothetical protein
VIGLLKNTAERIPDDLPMHPAYLFNSERVASVLSSFGYQAPSPRLPSCPKVKLARGGDPPKNLVFRLVAVESAVSDWLLTIKSKEITNNPATLSKAFKDRQFNGGDKKMIWASLVDLVNAEAVAAGLDIVGNLEDELDKAAVEGDGVFDY